MPPASFIPVIISPPIMTIIDMIVVISTPLIIVPATRSNRVSGVER